MEHFISRNTSVSRNIGQEPLFQKYQASRKAKRGEEVRKKYEQIFPVELTAPESSKFLVKMILMAFHVERSTPPEKIYRRLSACNAATRGLRCRPLWRKMKFVISHQAASGIQQLRPFSSCRVQIFRRPVFFSRFQHDSGNFHAIVALLDFLPGRPAKELFEAVCAVFAPLLAALPVSRKRKRLERRLRDVSASSPCSPENFPARVNWEHEDRSFGNFGMAVRLQSSRSVDTREGSF